jgi:hypothetical protein
MTVYADLYAPTGVEHLTFRQDDDAVTLTGDGGSAQIGHDEVPSVLAAYFELQPQGFSDRSLEFPAEELDRIVESSGRMLVLRTDEHGDDPVGVFVEHPEHGYLVVLEGGEDRVKTMGVRPLDVWSTFSLLAAHEVLT